MKLFLSISSTVLLVFTGISALAWEVTWDLNTWVETWIGGEVVGEPTADPVAGSYSSTQSVTLNSEAPYMCYTTDSSDPSCNWSDLTCATWTKYSSLLSISNTTTVKAIACYQWWEESSIWSFTYTIWSSTSTWGGWWGWGWGWSSPILTCKIEQLACSDKWIIYRRSGDSCNWGGLWDVCTPWESLYDSTGTWDNEWSGDYEYSADDYTIAMIYQSMEDNSSGDTLKLMNKIVAIFEKMTLELVSMSETSDKIRELKNEYFRSFNDILLHALDYRETKDKQYKKKAQDELKDWISIKWELDEYIDSLITIEDGIYIPVDSKLKSVFLQIQKILFARIDSLKALWKISDKEYDEFTEAYNKFVFAVIIFKKEWSDNAKKVWKAQIAIILKFYSK